MGSEALNGAESLVLASGSVVVVWLGTTVLGSPWGIGPCSF